MLMKLRGENEILKREREMLKKAAAIFSGTKQIIGFVNEHE